MSWSTLLIANRGEIAVRIARTARRLGYRTVGVYSEADAGSPHLECVDEALLLGGAPARESYLSIPRLLEAARKSGAGGIHPGYGFLSENAELARACEQAGLCFVGAPAAAIALMGDKRAAKRRMLEAGVPCVPGYEGDSPSDAELVEAARALGVPLMVKALAGGGGRGMRRVDALDDLPQALAAARAEALSAFGSAEVLLERVVDGARHVEVQVFADRHGSVVQLGERDCSVQRRFQKVVEESPSPAVDAGLRARLGATATAAARACAYVGAGTVELLLGPRGDFYFLEMNTRLQVEHPVTELVTGLDLVEWQLRVAAGEPLPLTQSEVRLSGHAIEARLYAEAPRAGFVPQTGKVLVWQPPEGTRVDHALAEGVVVGSHYDAMLAKLVVHGQTRSEACRLLHAALQRTTLLGVVTNQELLLALTEAPDFVEGRATTEYLPRALPGLLSDDPERLRIDLACAALALCVEGAPGLADDLGALGWRNASPIWVTLIFEVSDGAEPSLRASAGRSLPASVQHLIRVQALGKGAQGWRFGFEHEPSAGAPGGGAAVAATPRPELQLELVAAGSGVLRVVTDGVLTRVRYALDGAALWLDRGRGGRCFVDVTQRPARPAGAATSGEVRAPLEGRVTRVAVAPGDSVAAGAVLVTLEAMKMEHRLVGDLEGRVAEVLVSVGAQVEAGRLLVRVQARSDAGGDA